MIRINICWNLEQPKYNHIFTYEYMMDNVELS